jgi:hypothetical protein
MATTPTYSWPIPDDTDLVKDGAEAIRDLGNAIDTTVDGLPGAGLVHIQTTAFSGATAHSFGSDAAPIFTSDYTNYRIILDSVLSSTGPTFVDLRVRANTTDLSASNYIFQQGEFTGASTVASRSAAATSIRIGAIDDGANEISSFVIEMQNPQASKYTTIHSDNLYLAGGTGPVNISIKGYVFNTNAYNGFSILGSNNFSGTMSVYGYKK